MGGERKGPVDQQGVEELPVGCRTPCWSYTETVIEDMANIIALDCLTYILIVTSVPFRK